MTGRAVSGNSSVLNSAAVQGRALAKSVALQANHIMIGSTFHNAPNLTGNYVVYTTAHDLSPHSAVRNALDKALFSVGWVSATAAIIATSAVHIGWHEAVAPQLAIVSPDLHDTSIAPSSQPSLGMSDETVVAIQARFLSLRELAAEEDVIWNDAAERDAVNFLSQLSAPSRPAIALDDNGDIRMLWENMLREQVGIRFKGKGVLEAVLFQHKEHGMRREVVTAGDNVIIQLIKEMKLVHVTRG